MTETISNIDAMILDMDGVIWRGTTPLGDLPEIFNTIKSKGIKFAFATNNSSKNIDQYLEKFRSFNVEIEPWQILSSSIATVQKLKERYTNGGNVYVVGESGLIATLKEYGFHLSEENVLAVIAGIDRKMTYEKIDIATQLIRKGAAFYGTNPDKTYPTPDGLAPGAGTMIAAIEAGSETNPIIIGKPYPTIINMAIERLDVPSSQTLVVGDRLDTDILAGKQAGCRTAYVLTGVGTRHDLEKNNINPDYVANDLTVLLEMIQ